MTSEAMTRPQEIEYRLGGAPAALGGAQDCVFQVHYGRADFVDASTSPARMGIAMQSDGCPVDLVENWYGDSSAEKSTGSILDGQLHYIELGNEILYFGELGRFEDVEASSYQSYNAILDSLQQKGFHTLVRSWNFIPQINHSPDGAIEIYQQFCKGRALAFDARGIDEFQLPAATGIGSYATAITGYLIASKRAGYLHVENPLQSPAYKYPPKFGPKSPSFARGTLHLESDPGRGRGTRFFLSGTASIRGAETMWPGDVRRQLNTLMENIRYLISDENPQLAQQGPAMNLADFDHFKVYFRHAKDYDIIRRLLLEDWQIPAEKLHFMNVDICRSDLLVELEGCINDTGPVEA
ncbi:MAG: chorismatase [Pseudophaeobacter arcticus]|jgi:chorismate lyase/3-hydroxybenzoate synthase